MNDNMVSFSLETLPPISPRRMQELRALADRPNSEIDFSDSPPLSDEQLANAVRGRLYRPIKQQITARIDADVLAWLQSPGAGYQSRMNVILRRAMLADMDAPK